MTDDRSGPATEKVVAAARRLLAAIDDPKTPRVRRMDAQAALRDALWKHDREGPRMTIQEVRDRVAEVGRLGLGDGDLTGRGYGDPEAGHSDEDALRGDVLRAIATGTAEDPAEMARLALTTGAFDFARWYA